MSADASGSRVYPTRPFLAVSAAVWRSGRVLLARRPAPPFADCFTLPGGGVELGETLTAAAKREVLEETGVEAVIGDCVGPVEIIARDAAAGVRSHFVVLCFAARWLAGEGTIGPEASEILWAETEDIARLPLTPGLEPLLRRAATMIPA